MTNSVPLLLDPSTGRKWSAAINDYVDQMNNNNNNNAKNDIRSSPSLNIGNETIIIEDNDEMGESVMFQSPKSTVSSSHRSVSSPTSSSKIQIVHQTIDALYTKIDAARQLLLSTRDISQSRTAAALINECGVAIRALESVSPS